MRVARLSLGFCLGLAVAGLQPAAAEPPQRLLSLSGPLTEIVYARGAGDSLVAVDGTSQHPEAARALPNVGYPRQLSAEPILSQAPDLVLAGPETGPPQVLQQLAEAGVDVARVEGEDDLEGVKAKVAAVAQILDREEAGEALLAQIDTQMEETRRLLAEIKDSPRVLFLLSAQGGAALAAGRETAADSIITLAGGTNVIKDFTGYKPLTPEAAVHMAPEVILLPEHSLAALGGSELLLARPELADTPAAQAGRVVVMDALLLLGFGPRTPEAVRQLALALHPDIAAGEEDPRSGNAAGSGG